MNTKNFLRIICLLYLSLFSIRISGQEADSLTNKLIHYIRTIDHFSKYIPQEKVYLHFDNTNYYQGDNIWFKCYVVNSEFYRSSNLSKTLYVELLNPGGEIVDKRVLKLENGQCHGEFTLNQIPFYSGFYEVRAYTRYMLNFGDDVLFSRRLPVFDKPKQEGNFEEKNIQNYRYLKYPMLRDKPEKGKKINVKFFPEGGNLIEGVTSQVAFEATDAFGNPIEVTGSIINEAKEEVSRFSTTHNGRGVFFYTPTANKHKALVVYEDKKTTFDMPITLPQGYVMRVDNLSNTDSIGIAIQRNKNTPPALLGMAVISGGKLQNFFLTDVTTLEGLRFKINKSKLPSGVSWIVLFNSNGSILCDRLIFTNRQKILNIKSKTNKASFSPFDPVEMEFSLSDSQENPVQAPFSVSIKDGKNEVESGNNILTNLLLMSEVKGYIHQPSYYFEADDAIHRKALDLLLMVQGWRRYSWKQMAGITPFELKYKPEQGIEINGRVVSFVKSLPKPGVSVSSFLCKRGEEEKESANFMDVFTTDSLGRFSFTADVQGKWNMILAVTDKGKKKDYRVLLDRVFSPKPQPYQYAEMQVNIANDMEMKEQEVKDTALIEEKDTFLTAYIDSLAKKGEKIHRLAEVTVTAKKRSKEKDIFESRSKSVAYYDVQSEMDDIKDNDKYVGDDIHELLINMNKNFTRTIISNSEYLQYKWKMPLMVVNYERTEQTEIGYSKYKLLRLSAIKSIYITEDLTTMCRYADPRMTPLDVDDFFSCAVLIETYPEDQIPAEAGKGVRKTWLDGYSQIKEFYSPDYSVLPKESDYRRTLYWNPSVMPDESGKAIIRFYNNSNCKKFKISAETVTTEGAIGIYKE